MAALAHEGVDPWPALPRGNLPKLLWLRSRPPPPPRGSRSRQRALCPNLASQNKPIFPDASCHQSGSLFNTKKLTFCFVFAFFLRTAFSGYDKRKNFLHPAAGFLLDLFRLRNAPQCQARIGIPRRTKTHKTYIKVQKVFSS